MKTKLILGWVAVGLSTFIASFWAFWGVIENFHEGWYNPSLIQNLGLMFIQYLSPMLITMFLTLLALRWNKVGGSIYALIGLVFSIWIFSNIASRGKLTLGIILSWIPVTALFMAVGILYFFGRPKPLKLAYTITIGFPLLVTVIFAIEPIIRVSGRINDGNREIRLVEGNNVKLIWAPEGPGCPDGTKSGVNWEEANKICQYLTEDGKTLADTLQNIWRLPTIEETVRSLTRHNENAGGVWDAETGKATYEIQPDKESPLWNTQSMIIYWWTATEYEDEKYKDEAYRITYNGLVTPFPKHRKPNYLGFRAVKDIPINSTDSN